MYFGFRHNAGPKLYVGRANDKSLRLLRRQVVDRRDHLLTIDRTDFDHGKSLFLGRLFSETPFILKPRFFRLFHDETYLDGFVRKRATDEGNAQRSDRHCRNENTNYSVYSHGDY